MKAVAFVLPQFHPIPENDKWWGCGFTEWTNVTKARPLFKDHYQPHLPRDLGFYDLRLAEARAAQATLASEFGIFGFCYYHYWFEGKRLLERPVNSILASGEPDFPFCLCWANESWSRRWDGCEKEILIDQKYSARDDINHIRSLIPAFQDSRYILVDGKPLFLVYNSIALPDSVGTTDRWREEANRAGLLGLYLVRVESHGVQVDPLKAGFDAALEFQPFGPALSKAKLNRFKWWQRERLHTRPPVFKAHSVYSYPKLVEAAMLLKAPDYPWLRSVCPSWDNSPRRRDGAIILHGSDPSLFATWLDHVVNNTPTTSGDAASLVFVNAWNEWAEGNHLEPCQRWGRGYLEAMKQVLIDQQPCRVGCAVS